MSDKRPDVVRLRADDTRPLEEQIGVTEQRGLLPKKVTKEIAPQAHLAALRAAIQGEHDTKKLEALRKEVDSLLKELPAHMQPGSGATGSGA